MGPWVRSVVEILNQPGARQPVHVEMPLDGAVVVASEVPPGTSVRLDGVLEWAVEGVLATGTVAAPWRGECRRCLTPVGGVVEAPVQELFERRPVEGETYPLAGDEVDLEPMVREAVLLALPLAPLCREECLGICPTCGADRNEGMCACVPDERDPRWAALDILRGEGEGAS
jgi:uncharacterized protein